jgi:hypothetical protein
MIISIHELREDEKRRQQQEEQQSQHGNSPWQEDPEPPVGVFKFIRSMAER